MHQAYWLLKQIHGKLSSANSYINIRCIHNTCPEEGKKSTSITVFDTHVLIKDFKKHWEESLLHRLIDLNSDLARPANIYYAVNATDGKGHKKENFLQCTILYLDLDENSKYTCQQRWAQIEYLIRIGFAPSFVLSSGHGYHAFWRLRRGLPPAESEALLRRMVALMDCKEGGNTWDISRVLRLPGFRNVKNWYKGDTPPCAIVYPENWEQVEWAEDWEPEYFEAFPPASLAQLETYIREANKLCSDPTEFQEKLQQVLKGVSRVVDAAKAEQVGQTVGAQQQANLPPPSTPSNKEFEPKLKVVPPAANIKWGNGNSWMKRYCQKGWDAYTPGELAELKEKLHTEDVSASYLDFLVIFELCKKGYTRDAAREYWVRPENKLYRQEKEAKNANYFDASYEKALTYVRAIHAQVKPETNGEIYVKDHMTFISKGESSDVLLTAELKLNGVYADKDADEAADRDWYSITAIANDVTKPNGVVSYDLFINNNDFSSVENIKKHSQDLLRVFSTSNAQVQKLAHFLEQRYRNVPRSSFHSKVMYSEGEYVYPTFTVTKDAVLRREDESEHIKGMLAKIPFFRAVNVQFLPHDMTLAQLRQHWGHTLSMHLPEVVSSLIGMAAVSSIAPLFEKELGITNFSIPTLNIRGTSLTAKSLTVQHLYSITGLKHTDNTLGTRSSDFGLGQIIGRTNFLSIIIDEFKTEKYNKQKMEEIRNLVRCAYTGESIIKGRKDGSIVSTRIKAGLIVVGETAVERVGDISEISRVVPVSTDTFQPELHMENWHHLENIQWCELAPLWLQFVLHQDLKALYAEFQALRKEIIDILAEFFSAERIRIGSNLACLVFGCRVYDRFILSLDQNLPTIEATCRPQQALIECVKIWTELHEHTLKVAQIRDDETITETISKPITYKLFAKNELFDLLQYYATLLETDTKAIREEKAGDTFLCRIDEKRNELVLHLDTVYQICFRMGRLDDKFIYAKAKYVSILHAAWIKKESWIIDRSRQIKGRGNTVRRCLILKLTHLRQMGLWPDPRTLRSADFDTTTQDEDLEDKK